MLTVRMFMSRSVIPNRCDLGHCVEGSPQTHEFERNSSFITLRRSGIVTRSSVLSCRHMIKSCGGQSFRQQNSKGGSNPWYEGCLHPIYCECSTAFRRSLQSWFSQWNQIEPLNDRNWRKSGHGIYRESIVLRGVWLWWGIPPPSISREVSHEPVIRWQSTTATIWRTC